MKKHTWNNNQTQEAKGKRYSVDPKVVKWNVFYSLGCEWNLTLGFFQTNPWTLMPTTSPQEPTTTQILLSLTPPRGAFHSRKDALVTGEAGYCMEFNTISLKEMKPVWCSWDWSGITENHKEGYSTANFTLLPISFPNTTVRLIQALPMAKLSALKHLCKELWKQIYLSLPFFFILFRDVLTGPAPNTN